MGREKRQQDLDYALRLYQIGALEEDDLVEMCRIEEDEEQRFEKEQRKLIKGVRT